MKSRRVQTVMETILLIFIQSDFASGSNDLSNTLRYDQNPAKLILYFVLNPYYQMFTWKHAKLS